MTRVIINGKAFDLSQCTISYRELVELAGYNGDDLVTVTYRTKSVGDVKREGSLYPGRTLFVSDGTIINIADTSAA